MAECKRSFEAGFKLKVVAFAETNTNRSASRRFSVNEKRVREWRKQKGELLLLPPKKRRLEGGGRKAALPEMEEELAAWIESLRSQNLRVTRSSIQSKALELSQGRGEDKFNASDGWLQKFMTRQQFSLRRKTTVSQRLPSDIIPKVTNFILTTRKLRLIKKYPLSHIGNMDETPLWFDMPGETTITHTGERSVPVRTTGLDKGRYTVVLAAMADGTKLKPFVVFKGVRPVAELSKVSGVTVAYSRNGWMNEELTIDWVKRGWGTLNFGRRLLVWDAYKCHLMPSVKNVVNKQTNTDLSIIPGGLTSKIQPADVSWNKPFKVTYKAKYNQWMVDGEKSYTAAGNVRAPNKLLCLQWVKEAWESVSSEIVKKYFLSCGISVKTDGTEDTEIHCMKENEVAFGAREAVMKGTYALLQPQLVDEEEESDPFADLDLEEEDEDDLTNNEVVLDDC